MIHARAGPATPAGPRHPHGVHQPDQLLVSASCPGVSRVARFRPRPSQTVWSLVVSPPRDRPSACWRLAWIGVFPFSWHQRRADGPAPPWSRSARASPAHRPHPPGSASRPRSWPRSHRFASARTLVDRLPWPVALGQVPPGHPAAHRNTMPLRTCRWSRQRPPRCGVIAGSKGASRSHSSSVISNRRFTASFYRTTRTPTQTHQRSEQRALAVRRPIRPRPPRGRVPGGRRLGRAVSPGSCGHDLTRHLRDERLAPS